MATKFRFLNLSLYIVYSGKCNRCFILSYRHTMLTYRIFNITQLYSRCFHGIRLFIFNGSDGTIKDLYTLAALLTTLANRIIAYRLIERGITKETTDSGHYICVMPICHLVQRQRLPTDERTGSLTQKQHNNETLEPCSAPLAEIIHGYMMFFVVAISRRYENSTPPGTTASVSDWYS